ncbi:MAG: hypothetical protein AB8D78_12280 [Akkermansiaceae bacterium]
MKLEDHSNQNDSEEWTVEDALEEARLARLKRKDSVAKISAITIAVVLGVAVVVYVDLSRPGESEDVAKKEETSVEKIRITVSAPKEREKPVLPEVKPEVEEAVVSVVPEKVDVTPVVEAADPDAGKKRFADADELILVGLDSGRDEAIQRDEEFLVQAVTDKEWSAYRGLLNRSIQLAFSKVSMGGGLNRYDSVWTEPILYQAFLRWHALDWLSKSNFDSSAEEFVVWFLKNPEAMEEFLVTVQPEDSPAKVIEFLIRAWDSNAETYEKYFPLALACAVVFDQPMAIAHPLGSSESGARALVDPIERYMWYVEKNESSKLAVSIDRSSAKDLVWVVCAPIAVSEMEWSLDKMHLRRGKWGNAYGMIEYLMERAVDGVNPYEEYSFEEILKEGGICGDQTYFCVNTARAQGIPAISLSGETDLGGHAWAAVKVDKDEWDTTIGRIGGVSKGEASDPQIRRRITEQEIQLWNDRHQQSPAVKISVAQHLWLAEFFRSNSDKEERRQAIYISNKIGRSFLETWVALFSLLKEETKLVGTPKKPENLEEWKAFANDMRREFKDNPRIAQLAAKAELEFIFPYGSASDAKTAFIRERRRIERESGEQMDLIASSLKREADLMIKRGDPDAMREIGQLYDGALRDYGSSVTGFKMMARDYFGFFRDDPEGSVKAVRDIELAFKRVIETGTKDWFRAKTETSIYRMICGYYREVGEEDRAVRMEKRMEILMRRAKRGAD